MWSKSALPIFIVLLVLAVNVSAYPYTIPYYAFNETISSFDTLIPSFETDAICINQQSAKSSMSGSLFSLTSTFTGAGFGNPTSGTLLNQNTFTCKNIGSNIILSPLNGIYEGFHTVSFTASSGNVTLTQLYNCTESDFYFNNSINSTTDLDTYGNVVNRYQDYQTSLQDNTTITGKITEANFNDCTDIEIQTSPYFTQSLATTSASALDRQAQFFYPFNTSAGKIIYNISTDAPYITCLDACIEDIGASVHLFLVNMETGDYETLGTQSVDCSGGATISNNFEGVIRLTSALKESMYAFVMVVNFDDSVGCGGASRSFTMKEPEYVDYDVFVYRADFECSQWSECVDSSQTRTCVDPMGIAENEIEFRACFESANFSVDLGFELFKREALDTFVCNKNWFFCGNNLNLTPTYTPSGWYLSRSYATNIYGITGALENFCTRANIPNVLEGSFSLKCWTLPSGDEQPLPVTIGAGDDVICGSFNETRVPEVEGLFNESLFVSANISFINPFVQLKWAVKRCDEAPEQYTYGDCLGCCGDKCYGDCNVTPIASYTVKMADIGERRTDYVNYDYNFFNHLDQNKTDAVKNAQDGSYSTVIMDLDGGDYGNLSLILPQNFTDNMTLGLFIRPFDGIAINKEVYITDVTGADVYGQFTTSGSFVAWSWRNITLSGIPADTNRIFISDGLGVASSFKVSFDKIVVEEFDTFIEISTLFEFSETLNQSVLGWSRRIMDLTTAGIVPDHNYTIGFTFNNPVESSTSNCLYIDGVKGAYTTSTITPEECVSDCGGTDNLNYFQRQLVQGSCLEVETINDYRCTGATQGATAFCIDDILHYFIDDLDTWDKLTCTFDCNEARCLSQEEAEAISQGATITTGGEQLTDELIDAIQSRLFWALVIILCVTLPIMLTVAMFTKDGKATFFTAIIIAIMLTVFFSAINPPWIPIEYMALIVLVCVLGAVALLKDVFT